MGERNAAAVFCDHAVLCALLLDSEYCFTAYLHFFMAVIFVVTNNYLVLVLISFLNNYMFNAATY